MARRDIREGIEVEDAGHYLRKRACCGRQRCCSFGLAGDGGM